MNHEEIIVGVKECLGVVLDIDPGSINETDTILGDLGADSLDLLDLIFQLEQRFEIKISPKGIERRAQAKLGDVPLEIDGKYTPQALEQLREIMPETPTEEFCEGLPSGDLPKLFRAATFVNLVSRLMEEQNG